MNNLLLRMFDSRIRKDRIEARTSIFKASLEGRVIKYVNNRRIFKKDPVMEYIMNN